MMREARARGPAAPFRTQLHRMKPVGLRLPSPGALCALLSIVPTMACQPAATASTQGPMTVNGTELFVKRMGAGDPVLVVHGGPVMEHGYLLPWLEPLARDHELIFFDQRLSGRSAAVVDSASVRLDTLVADMEGIRQGLGVERWDVLAHSWGGLLAQRYAMLHPERVASMVLVSPMAASAALWQAEERALAARVTPEHQAETARLRQAPGLMAGDTAAIAAILRHGFRLQFHEPARASELALYVPSDYLERSRQFGYMMPDLVDFDFHDGLAVVTAPVLLVFGEDEPGAEMGGAALEAALPNARMIRIPGAGHFPFMEAPEAFLARVRDFLAER